MKVTNEHYYDTDEIYAKQYYCPACQQNHMKNGTGFIRVWGYLLEYYNYCPSCGIKLEWELYEDEDN